MPRWIAWPGPWSNTPAEPPNLLGGKPINSPIFKAIISPNNRFMRKALLLATLFVCTTLAVLAQRMVTGKILDANGMPLSGVTIKAVKSGKMALTGADGSFSLAAAENDMLELSSVGFQKQTVSAKSSTLSVKMSTSVETMGEVVMVGSRRSGRVKTETMAPVDVINVGQATATTGMASACTQDHPRV